ncbi:MULTISPECIES: sugar-transfer associated ATP-grasp domain-containing protein [Arenibacter]|uniref:sugar-transfer associated ATP-grasp domain-containing protein n=1 Tax=Arenibacter TaxID=178469 RepID=UPI00068D3179|nr:MULTISPECIES: sugar-transfer associated ATP-grasp domain-containing protein [Arenibacter]GBF20473.1 carbamoyl phosphate synthase-like protein [Arenibacter sp. NBRC 103722]
MFKKLFQIQNRQGIIGLNRRNLDLIYPNNHKRDYKLADDKVKTKEILHSNKIACADTYAVIRNVSDIKREWAKCINYGAIAVKPANGSGGGGIKIIKKEEDGTWSNSGIKITERQIFQHITAIVSGFFSRGDGDHCLIEECIVPHPFFAEIYDEGVPDFRIITLKNTPIMSMLRMPTSKSGGMANLHQNGVGIGVDMVNGRLTQVYDGKNYRDHHPDNPKSIKGVTIPFWKEIMALSIATSKAFPLDYLGIDLVIDKTKGPQIMEVNVRPGLAIQLVNQCGLQKAIDHLFQHSRSLHHNYQKLGLNSDSWAY